MRPLRVQVEGFSVYRGRVEVDFSDVDFFSLAGPTGSGKSSLIDAMVFALFGRVPRLGGKAVAPVITAGTDRARVRFDFEVDGVEYTAVREARRTATGGASVREARLEQNGSPLADGADDVTTEIEELLRLRFEDFTRTVVLPQGEFARFLQATKSERQGLLRSLLGFEVYTRMRELARTRAAVATERADGARRALETLDVPDETEQKTALERRHALVDLAERLPVAEKELAELEKTRDEVADAEKKMAEAVERLEAIEEPDRLEDLEALSAEAKFRVVDAEEKMVVAADAVESAEKTLKGLPSVERVQLWKRAWGRLEELDTKLESDDVDYAMRVLATAEARLEEGVKTADQARSAANGVRTRHAAHLLTTELVPGEPCPVCETVVSEVPVRQALPEIEELEAAEKTAERGLALMRTAVEKARTELVALEANRSGLVEQRDLVKADLEGAPSLVELAEVEETLVAAAKELEEARAGLRDAEDRRKKTQRDLEDIADESRSVAKRLREAELTVADLEPPGSEADDVVVQWKDLLAWRDQKLEHLIVERSTTAEKASRATERVEEARQALEEDLASHGVSPIRPLAVQVATAVQEAKAIVESHEKAKASAVSLAAEIGAAEEAAAVANALANHLKADGFERWLMAGALADLVEGANTLLAQLSDGGYSLHSDDAGTFSIVDHRNADEMRSVSTLSGGETFLVSLALALSLAETLAAKGGSGLESIILDEGFGTLDEESLDTVASVLEELTGRGLMVGVITHVKELAARAPVRYEVTREPTGAKVKVVS